MDDNKKERIFGEETDRLAARQLGVSDDYTIFSMAVDVIESLDEHEVHEAIDRAYEENGAGLDDYSAKQLLTDHIRSVKLPKGWALVGMQPLGDAGRSVYGLVNLVNRG